MFDILTDVWAHPGAAHAPILPFDISDLTAETADSAVSDIHKYGIDTLMITCEQGKLPADGVLEAVFAAAAKRYMLIFADESLVCTVMGCSDSAFTAYNPMLASHRLALQPADSDSISPYDEVVLEVSLKIEDGKITDAVKRQDAPEGYKPYRFVQVSDDSGIDLLCTETCDMLIFGAYESFVQEYKESFKGVLAGLVSDRLADYLGDNVYWSYDMLRSFNAVGGDLKMLASLFMKSDKRTEKEAVRLYRKALSSALEAAYCRPASEWCGKNSLAFAGEVPYRFASVCGRRFTVPVWSRDGFCDNCESDSDIITGVRVLADTARGEGFTGAAFRAVSEDADGLIREAHIAFAGSAALFILPPCYASAEHMNSRCIRREDMRRICTSIKRMSTLGTSCGSKTSCAVLFEDEMIPFSGVSKLRETGVDFNFVSKDQIMERGRSHHGELLIDKFRYSSLLIDQRIRLEPAEVMKIGEFASHDGKMYRGGSFGDFAKKNLPITDFDRACAAALIKYETVKCSCLFLFLVNRTDSPVVLKMPYDTNKMGYILDVETGKKSPMTMESKGDEKFTTIRVLPHSTFTVGWDVDNSPAETGYKETVREIVALGCGDNIIELAKNENSMSAVEIDSIQGYYCELTVNGKAVPRILYPPYHADLTKYMTEGDNTITLESDGEVKGVVLRITDTTQ